MSKFAQRFQALGINQPLAVRLERLITKWERSSGPEWTVKRLKELKTEFLGILSNDPRRTAWVSRNSEGLPKGPFAELFRIGMSGEKGATRALSALMVYSNFVSDTITESQKEKFFGSMESKDITGLSITVEKQYPVRMDGVAKMPHGKPWTNQQLSPQCFQPGPDGKSYPETDTYISFVTTIASRPMMSLIRRYTSLFNEVFPTQFAIEMDSEGTVAMKHSESPYNTCVGKISFIQEPGFKLRAVANPNRVLQAALEPLKMVLRDFLLMIDEDYTFDQSSGVQVVKGWLERGLTVHSVDLSDATNLFPLNFTVSVLEALNPFVQKSDQTRYLTAVKLFRDASRSDFFSKENGVTSVRRFTRGQPLGLGPSFFAFALSHHYLIQRCGADLSLKEQSYCILGDDIVICDDRLHARYRKVLGQLGCKVSEGKSFSSQEMAEFAGKIIMRNNVIPQFKWRDASDQNIVDFCRNIGPKAVDLLNNRQRRLITYIAKVPTFLGGLGWNPDGTSLTERLADPFVDYILNKQTEVLAPSLRVDRPLVNFSIDPRLKDLTPRYITVDGLKELIPTRDTTPTQWGTRRFWGAFWATQDSSLPFETLISSDAKIDYARIAGAYLPLIKESSDPRQQTPWFDVIRYFNERVRKPVKDTKTSA